ncbi:metallophosphoesterase [Kordia jejudonensis]|uniref:metallophosphoesterase n=1 Tax=Kordia jejudonensis TaxID=1348245 RepID=UPI000629B3D5|nr:metallophosphoesterase [Kordia jejudonensis]
MKTNFLYVLLLSVLFFACKGKTDSKSNSTPDPKAEPAVTAVPDATMLTNKFLVLSDVHVDKDLANTTFGNSYVSVTSENLWKKAKAKIENVVQTEQPKFMVYLGDLPGYDDNERRENTHEMLENLRNLQIGIPILYLPGNNDSLEGDYHSFTNSNGNSVLTKDADPANPWPIINKASTVIRAINLDFNKEFGYYSVDLVDKGKKLTIIALNTVIFSNSGSHPYVGDDGKTQQEATNTQMDWFKGKLKSLGATDRVLIMMHIPPGTDGYKNKHHHSETTYDKMWHPSLLYTMKNASGTSVTYQLQDAFIELISKHKSNIIGMLNGHTHLDGLRRVVNSTPKQTPEFITYSITTPGIAVNHGNNPGFKMFTYNASNFDLLDFKTYYALPTNKAMDGDFQFSDTNFYTFRQAYNSFGGVTTIKSVLENSPKDSVVKNMYKTIGVKTNQNVNNNMNLDTAYTVYKQK